MSATLLARLAPAVIAGVSMTFSAVAVVALYFLVMQPGHGGYFQSDTVLLAGVTIAACGALANMIRRNRLLAADLERAEARIELSADRQWELREAEERTKTFLESHGDLIVRRDPSGRITYVNDAFCALANRDREQLVGTRFAFDIVEQGDIAVLADGTRVHDQRIEWREGPRWIAWREAPVRGDADDTEILSIGRDVTDRALSEHALAEARDLADAANRAKSRFLAMVSHEIRTPLNGILGMADLLLDTPLTPEQSTYAKAVKTSGDTLMSLIGEILDFSKIEAGRLDLDARPFALSALVEELVELLSPRAQAKGIEIASFVDPAVATTVTGDATRLRQVLLNLAGNAVKFTDQGGVSVVVEPGIWPDEIAFTVRDTGIGIAPDLQARIFEEFEQADSSSTRRHGGTGLGLAISKRIVERMGGTIAVDSTPGAGSAFTFTIALPRAADAALPAVMPDLAGAAVMIVAPTPVEAGLVARRLDAWGARACVVSDAAVALTLLPERSWDTIIVDRGLGAAAADTILRACPRDTVRRIVVLTPAERHELATLKQAGFSGYLVKPVRAASLAARFGDAAAFDAADATDRDGERSAAREAGSLSILVAEDNEINALLARALLTKLGHRPNVAGDGGDAVESWLSARASGEPYDLVLMDVHMPRLDGLEAARRIRAVEAERGDARMPIIALTASAFSDDREACLAAGMDGFLTKPLDRERLAEAILGRSGIRRAA